jgi:hypothetical protein
MVWNLLAGAIGFSFYVLLGLASFAKFVAFPPISSLHAEYFLYVVLLGVVGAGVAILAGADAGFRQAHTATVRRKQGRGARHHGPSGRLKDQPGHSSGVLHEAVRQPTGDRRLRPRP